MLGERPRWPKNLYHRVAGGRSRPPSRPRPRKNLVHLRRLLSRSPNVPSSSLPSATDQRELQKAVRALPRALKGWRDVKTLFEFAGIYPAKDNSPATDP